LTLVYRVVRDTWERVASELVFTGQRQVPQVVDACATAGAAGSPAGWLPGRGECDRSQCRDHHAGSRQRGDPVPHWNITSAGARPAAIGRAPGPA